jgi:hypothetical protein
MSLNILYHSSESTVEHILPNLEDPVLLGHKQPVTEKQLGDQPYKVDSALILR